MAFNARFFPEVYTNGSKPARRGVRDKDRDSLPTPAYAFGWVLSSVELFKALDDTDQTPLKVWLCELPDIVEDQVYARWGLTRYDDLRYNPSTPRATSIGEDHILIFLACNDSSEVMDLIMADKTYHEECRDTLNNPKTMKLEPAWFRVGLRGMPKAFIADLQKDDDELEQVDVLP